MPHLQCRPLLGLLAVAVLAVLSSVQKPGATAQLTLLREVITPRLPQAEDPYPNMMPRTCVECTSRAFFFWRNKKWPVDGVVEEDYVDRSTKKVKKWTHIGPTGTRTASITAEHFAHWCAQLFARRYMPLRPCVSQDMNGPRAAAIYDPYREFRIFSGVRTQPAPPPPSQTPQTPPPLLLPLPDKKKAAPPPPLLGPSPSSPASAPLKKSPQQQQQQKRQNTPALPLVLPPLPREGQIDGLRKDRGIVPSTQPPKPQSQPPTTPRAHHVKRHCFMWVICWSSSK